MNYNITDISTNTKEITPEEFKQQITPVIQRILDAQFKESPQKRVIRFYPDRINFACPLCGDSAHIATKKRGNIILRGRYKGIYKCHNCNASMYAYKFFDMFKDCSVPQGAMDYMYNAKSDANFGTALASELTGLLFDVEHIEELCPDRETFKRRFNLVECSEKNRAHSYLVGRCQYNYPKFLYSEVDDTLFVLNLTPSGKIFGYQTRALSGNREKNGMKYLSWNLTRMRKEMYMPEVDESLDYDQLSLIFNVLLINYEKPILITEGPMDAFLLPNCLAMAGGGRHIPLDFKLYFMYDSDAAGITYALNRLKNGAPVFMWSKFIEDMHLPRRKKWDWNDVIKYSRETGFRIPNLKDYFTENKLDAMYL